MLRRTPALFSPDPGEAQHAARAWRTLLTLNEVAEAHRDVLFNTAAEEEP
jgi:hypothetical protein